MPHPNNALVIFAPELLGLKSFDSATHPKAGVASSLIPAATDAERSREISAARRLVQISVDVVAQAMVAAWQARSRPLRSGPLHRV